MKAFLLICFIAINLSVVAQSDEQRIRSLMDEQSRAWNRNDIIGFMEPYWKNDSLMFIGKSGVTYGWQNTLDNYKRSYPDKDAMGQLAFDIIQVKRLSGEYFSVVGKWHLDRKSDDLSGHFTLIFRKIKNSWVIISDHSS